jgi:hypothetical protein
LSSDSCARPATMKLPILASLLTAASLSSANPLPEEKDNVVVVRDVHVVYKNCDVVTPKVFIISMVPILPTLSIPSSLTRPVRTRGQHLVHECQYPWINWQSPVQKHHSPRLFSSIPSSTLPRKRFSLPAHHWRV